MKIAKFGGTSMASAEQIKKAFEIVISDPARRLVVVSAPGKRYDNDIKVTDLLIRCAEKCLSDGEAKDELNAVVSRYAEIARDFNLSGDIVQVIEADLRKRVSSDKTDRAKFMDLLKAAGEDNCAKLAAECLRSMGVKAHYVNPGDAGLFLSDEFGNARVLPQSYNNLKASLNMDGIMIFPGFFGYSATGEVVTFPRGGSDITGSILAAAVDAEMYENFTDVDSVFSANPNIIPSPKPISILTYREMRELSYAGFSVLHEETLEPVYHKGIPVCIKNTNNPSAPGTMIVSERENKNGPVVGIAGDKGFCSIYLSKYMMNREIGFGRKMLQILEDEGIAYEHIPSGIDNVSVVIRERQLGGETEERVINRIKSELKVDDIFVVRKLAMVMMVGEGMKNTIGIAARAGAALARAGVNLEMINQGSSEVSMMFGVKEEKVNEAVKALYNEFF
ncbi:aspartate kinase [Anaerobacterium chartisolvens]|uniref:Aspartokinase n=1 Tax=Anaerobacterium chartisolvens TaxID=1297424 RepID=A0A369AUL7_9FIRM|nr:aspartate kinase [Anaerobacterium chartisolvens]RCX12733.1 aspartate kinase [Anaerobacterium chartisolvens]